MSYRDVWIIVPAFNEAQVIGDVIGDLRTVFEHVVCVDDGSRDDTADIALRAGAHVIRHPVNLGQGAAIQTGVEYARSRPGAAVFVTFDADGQHRVKDVVTMIDRLSKGTSTSSSAPVSPAPRSAAPAAEATDPARGGVAEPEQPAAASHRRPQRVAGVRPDRRRHPEPHDERDEPRQRVHQAHRRNHWRVAEEPVEILYTEYSMSKGQPCSTG